MSIAGKLKWKFKYGAFSAFSFLLKCFFSLLPRRPNTVLVIKNDGIGDYVLFRNYLQFLRDSAKYKNHRLYILANISYMDMAVAMDGDIVDGFLWSSDSFFLKWASIQLLYQLNCLRLSSIIYPNFSRKTITDKLVYYTNATHKIGVNGNTNNQDIALKEKTDQYYTQLIQPTDERLHEFDRNKQVIEAMCNEKNAYLKPFFNTEKLGITPHNKIVIFTGAGYSSKKWRADNYIQLCKMLIAGLNTNMVLVGGKSEIIDNLHIEHSVNNYQLVNETSLLTLTQLAALIGGAKLLITGDTVAVHMAAALNIPSVCIAKGDLYGRFVPYPPHISQQITCVLPRGFIADAQSYEQISAWNINDISVADVYNAVAAILSLVNQTN